MSLVNVVLRDLVEKRLWPVALVLVLATVAIPVAVSASGTPPAPPAGPALQPLLQTPLGLPAPGQALNAVAGAQIPQQEAFNTFEQNPFRTPFGAPSATPASKSSASSATSSSSKGAGPGAATRTTSTTTTTSGKGTSSVKTTRKTIMSVPRPSGGKPNTTNKTVAPTTPTSRPTSPTAPTTTTTSTTSTPSTPAAPTTTTTTSTTTAPSSQTNPTSKTSPSQGTRHKAPVFGALDSYALDIRVTDGTGGRTLRNVPRLSPLPSAGKPLLLYLGVLQGGARAAFLFASPVKLLSAFNAKCLPSKDACEIMEVTSGQTVGISLATTADPANPQMFLTPRIKIQAHRSVGAARWVRQQSSAQGRKLLLAADPAARNALSFSVATGSLSVPTLIAVKGF